MLSSGGSLTMSTLKKTGQVNSAVEEDGDMLQRSPRREPPPSPSTVCTLIFSILYMIQDPLGSKVKPTPQTLPSQSH